MSLELTRQRECGTPILVSTNQTTVQDSMRLSTKVPQNSPAFRVRTEHRLRVKTKSIKTKTLLASLGPEYDATLAGIDASGTASFEEVVSRLRRFGTRIKGQSEGLSDQNKALAATDRDEPEMLERAWAISHQLRASEGSTDRPVVPGWRCHSAYGDLQGLIHRTGTC